MTGLFFCYYRFVTFTAAFPLLYDGKAAIIFVEVGEFIFSQGEVTCEKNRA